MKKCATCLVEKATIDFDKNRRVCKECRRISRSKKHSNTCLSCGELFTSAKKATKYCSHICHGSSRKVKVNVTCSHCGKTKEVVPSLEARLDRFYCNQACRNEHLKTLMAGEENPNYSKVKTLCSGCSKTIEIQPYRLEKHRYQFCTNDCYQRNIGRFFTGEHNNNWNGNLSSKHREQQRLLPGYQNWRTSVFSRDQYTCQICKDSSGGNLVAHHLNSWDKHLEDRFSIENGITLCKSCHVCFHREFGYGNNTKEQFTQFTTIKALL